MVTIETVNGRRKGFDVVCPFCENRNDPDSSHPSCKCGAAYKVMRSSGDIRFSRKIRTKVAA